MKIRKDSYVVFVYSLKLDTGEELPIRETGMPIGFVMGQGHMLPAVERQLIGMGSGESATIFLEPKESFGAYNPEAIREVPRDHFPKNMSLTPTMTFQASSPNGPVTFTIQSVTDDTVIIDLNHPLAGRRIQCQVSIREVRTLTDVEKGIISGKKGVLHKDVGPFKGFPHNILFPEEFDDS